jgi:3-methyladenine DNA glycosylase AlkC
MIDEKEKFLLKDFLFNKKKVEQMASELKAVYPEFEDRIFVKEVLAKFPELELMERVYWIRDCLKEHLPEDYREAVDILLQSLPEPCDPALSDDDFGNFIYSPYSYFVAEYGLVKKDLIFSLKALKQMTTRFSVEGPIRFFINEFPRETLAELSKWARDPHYHVRRLASEGTRPSLPWAKKINIPHTDSVDILNILYADKTRFVTRSVANHLNDISKIDPSLVIKMLKVWKKLGRQDKKELDYMISHSLRTLVKDGHSDALALLGYVAKDIEVSDFKIHTKTVNIGKAAEFSFTLTSTSNKPQKLMIDYVVHFRKANGELTTKTHKLAKKILSSKEVIKIEKKHPLKLMTTRKLYTGIHKIELQINGQSFGTEEFSLKT